MKNISILSRLREVFEKKKSKEPGPDLFEYAEIQGKIKKIEENPSVHLIDYDKKRQAMILGGAVLLALLIGFLMRGFFCNRAGINRYAVLYNVEGKSFRTYISNLKSDEFHYKIMDNDGNLSENTEKLSLRDTVRIDFLEDPRNESDEESVEKNDTAGERQLSADEKRFLGSYSANVSGHRAVLLIYQTRNGYPGASMQFTTWGKGVREYMKRVRVNGNRITFLRSCSGIECAKIGTNSPIRQIYTGYLSNNGRSITGTYRGGRNDSKWRAERK